MVVRAYQMGYAVCSVSNAFAVCICMVSRNFGSDEITDEAQMKDVPISALSLRNQILAALPRAEWDRLRLGMVPVQLVSGQVLIEPNRAGEHVYFIERGFASVIANCGEKSAHVALVGQEGIVGGLSLLGGDVFAGSVVMHAPGEALRIPLPVLRLRLDQCPALRDAWLRDVSRFLGEVIQTAADSACSTLDQRCARWLLLADARVAGAPVPVTHEILAGMLGVFRSGVTVALSGLQALGLIQSSRGRVTVVDRGGLERFAHRSLRQTSLGLGATRDLHRPDIRD